MQSEGPTKRSVARVTLRDLRKRHVWVPLLLATLAVLLLPFWAYLSVSLMAVEPTGLGVGIVVLLLAIGCLSGVVGSILQLRKVVRKGRHLPGEQGRPLSILPFMATLVCLYMLIGPCAVLSLQLDKHPSQRQWQTIARELPIVLRREMFGL